MRQALDQARAAAAHPRRCTRRSPTRRHLAVRAADRHHRIPVDKIRDVIGPGGKMIRSISSAPA
jgi:polyribonucleotide nucleotidyltransferase